MPFLQKEIQQAAYEGIFVRKMCTIAFKLIGYHRLRLPDLAFQVQFHYSNCSAPQRTNTVAWLQILIHS